MLLNYRARLLNPKRLLRTDTSTRWQYIFSSCFEVNEHNHQFSHPGSQPQTLDDSHDYLPTMASDPLTSPVSPTSPTSSALQDGGVIDECLRALASLSGDADALHLQKLLSFFDPNAVHESVLTGAVAVRVLREFDFLSNDAK